MATYHSGVYGVGDDRILPIRYSKEWATLSDLLQRDDRSGGNLDSIDHRDDVDVSRTANSIACAISWSLCFVVSLGRGV